MQLSLSIKAKTILCRGISSRVDLQNWGKKTLTLSNSLPFKKYEYIPMMQARRMSHATGLACESFLEILHEHEIESAVFLSEHGELERSHKIIEALCSNHSISPTDFSMSVHNVAAGLSTILSKKSIEVSSISAGKDGLSQALYEVLVFLESGAKNVLLIAFDGQIPDFYYNYGINNEPTYAVALLFEKGDDWQITIDKQENKNRCEELPLPIQLAHGLFSNKEKFSLKGVNQSLHWTQNV